MIACRRFLIFPVGMKTALYNVRQNVFSIRLEEVKNCSLYEKKKTTDSSIEQPYTIHYNKQFY